MNSHKRQRPFHTVPQSVQSHSTKLVLLQRAEAYFRVIQLNSCTKVPQCTQTLYILLQRSPIHAS